MNKTIKALNAICDGWTESRIGGLLCNSSIGGGIIDCAIATGAWFVIFNDSRKTIEGLNSRDDAIEAYALASR